METKDVLLELRTKKGIVTGGAGRKIVCNKTGGVALGKRRNSA